MNNALANNYFKDDYAEGEFSPNCEKIAELNDNFRKTFCGGQIFMTAGIDALEWKTKMLIINKVRNFNNFDFRNDPYNEHDFGVIEVDGIEVYWKIDYYDKDRLGYSEDPSNPELTTRVLTILLPIEY